MPQTSLGMVAFSLFLLGIIAVLGIYDPVQGSVVPTTDGSPYNTGVYYLANGDPVMYANLTCVSPYDGGVESNNGYAMFTSFNVVTGIIESFPMYYDTGHQYPIYYKDIIVDVHHGIGFTQVPAQSKYWSKLETLDDVSGDASGLNSRMDYFSTGLTGLMVAVIAAVLLISVNVLSTGINAFGTRVLITTMFFSGLWAIVSLFGLVELKALPIFGWAVYMILSFVYFMGVWGLINTGGSF